MEKNNVIKIITIIIVILSLVFVSYLSNKNISNISNKNFLYEKNILGACPRIQKWQKNVAFLANILTIF